jgi:hypothetical protein
MSTLPGGKKNKIVYPDGSFGDVPSDGTVFIDPYRLGESYQWDGYLNEWLDAKGDVFKPIANLSVGFDAMVIPEEPTPVREPRCTCGAYSIGTDRHYTWCDSKGKQ